MKEFSQFLQLIGEAMPDLVSLLLCPVLLLAAGLALAVFHKEKAYLPLAIGLGGAGAFLVGCEVGASAVLFIYVAAYVVFAVLVKLLFLIPFPVRGSKEGREAELYEKFRVPLEVPADAEEEPPAEGESVRLEHALSLLEQLKKCNLSASDRLEADAIGHTLERVKGSPAEEDRRTVNDCLSTILKLTAKYKL